MASQVEEAKLVTVGGTDFLVDGFAFQRKDVQHYVLTHFHSDHTVGLSRSFSAGVIYCTEVTAALITELTGVDRSRVHAVPLTQAVEVGGARITFLDADHCPGSAMACFEALEGDQLTLHTGDCRASDSMRMALIAWLAGRRVETLLLDTTYCAKRWCFPPQATACEWLSELARRELEREPKTLFVVGAYQIGKERAVEAVARAADSPAFVEQRRWRVIQLAGWGDARLPSGKPLWSIDKEDCRVWLNPLGGLGHDALKHFLDSTKGRFEAVVAFRPTGWAWSPKAMSRGSAGCRVWADNDGKTRVYAVPYSEHSSYAELRALGEAVRPQRLIPTVNSETRAGRERMMAHFLGVVDLQADKERMDHYLRGGPLKAEGDCVEEFVDALALSGCGGSSSSTCPAPRPLPAPAQSCGSAAAATVAKADRRPGPTPCRVGIGTRRSWGAGQLRGLLASPTAQATAGGVRVAMDCTAPDQPGADADGLERAAAAQVTAAAPPPERQDVAPAIRHRSTEVVELSDSEHEHALGGDTESPGSKSHRESSNQVAEELRCVDVRQQQRLLAYFASLRKPQRGRPGKLRPRANVGGKRTRRAKGAGKGGGCASGAAEAPGSGPTLLARLGASVQKASKPEKATDKKRRRATAAATSGAKRRPRRRAASGDGDGTAPAAVQEGANRDPKLPSEKRPTRFVPRPSQRIRERIERAFGHRLYFLKQESLDDGHGVRLHVLGSTGNAYHADLRREGNACSCLDFAKAGGVCKHLLFVMLRILRLPRDDYKVWQTSLTASELQPLVARLRDESTASDVRADVSVLRGYRQACGETKEVTRRPLPADCPICFEEMPAEPSAGSAKEHVEFCSTCGHNMHAECRARWAAASRWGDACPLCRSPWVKEGGAGAGPINLAAYSSEHRDVSLASLYPETHRWIQRRDSEA